MGPGQTCSFGWEAGNLLVKPNLPNREIDGRALWISVEVVIADRVLMRLLPNSAWGDANKKRRLDPAGRGAGSAGRAQQGKSKVVRDLGSPKRFLIDYPVKNFRALRRVANLG